MSREAMKLALEALENAEDQLAKPYSTGARYAITALREALAEREAVLPGGGHVPAVAVAVYGYCPECGGAGVMRERRPNGDDKCTNGHKYPSSQALAEQPAQHRAWFTVDELNAWADKKLKENPQWAEKPAQVDPCIDGSCSCCWANLDEQPAQQEPVAHVMFRQDEDGLEPIMFYGPGTAPDPATLKDRFVLKDVWLSPPAQQEPAGSVYRYGRDSSGKKWHGIRWTASGLDLPDGTLIYTSPPAQRKPLTDEEWQSIADTLGCFITRGQKDAIEAALGIKGGA